MSRSFFVPETNANASVRYAPSNPSDIRNDAALRRAEAAYLEPDDEYEDEDVTYDEGWWDAHEDEYMENRGWDE